jgi:hypothetical protein
MLTKKSSSLFFCILFFHVLAFVAAFGHSAEVTLQWNPVDGSDGYRVYYGSVSRNYQAPENAGRQTDYTISLDPGVYYFAVTAYNNYGESGYSEEVSTTIAEMNPPTSVSLRSDLPSPQPEGTTVTFTAQADGGSGDYEYKFFLKDPSDQWSIIREYSSEPDSIWIATGNGENAIQACARNAGVDSNCQVYNTFTFRVDSIHTVTETPFSVMHVADIIMSTRKRGANVNATADVIVKDNSGAPVEGATVYGSWSGLTSASDTSVTDSDGVVSLESDRVKKPNGLFTFTVDNIIKDGWSYDPAYNVEASSSVRVP